MTSQQHRNAFTLVELMTALVVISILAAMVVAALSAAAGTARKAKAERQVQAVHELIAMRMEEFVTRRVAGAVCTTNPPTTVTLSGAEASRSRLIQIRHLLRTELPDRISDLTAIAPAHTRRAWTLNQDSNGDGLNDVWPSADEDMFNPVYSNLPTGYAKYRTLVAKLSGAPAGNPLANWTTTYESSECLYLILATSQVGGRSGLELIPNSQIADLDGDGVPEILDSWGNPMIWIRWPVGYWLTYPNRVEWLQDTASGFESRRYAQMQFTIDRLGKDQFDILQSDWRNFAEKRARPADIDSWDNVYGTFNIQPLVASAGPDGQFDLMLRSSDASGTWSYGDAVQYTLTTYPVRGTSANQQYEASPTYGSVPAVPADFYDNPYYFIDPYLSTNNASGLGHTVDYARVANPFVSSLTAGLPGAYFDANNDNYDNSSDNIFSLGAN